jgi:cytochrome c
MRSAILLLSAGLLLGAPLSADAVSEGAELVKKADCLSCHQPKVKVVGPAYVDVAKKYKGDAGAVAKLVKKVKNGGSGVWGQVPMAPHPTIADADLEKMVKWVLAGAPMTAAAAPVAAPVAAAPTPEPKKEEAAPAVGAKPHRTVKVKHHMAVEEGEGQEVLAWDTDEHVRAAMTKQDCFGCHAGVNSLNDPDKKPWPSFKQIEEKYHKNGDVEALVKKVADGEGKPKWGSIPHPVYENLTHDQVKAAVTYILAGKASVAPAAANTADMPAEEWMKTRSDCFSCHQVQVKVVGPAYKDVAAKYTAKDIPMLVKKVKAGGSGNWGNVPMAAHPTAPDAMLEKAVRWVLSQK